MHLRGARPVPGMRENVVGVYVGADPANVGNNWIPLFE